MLFEKQVVGFQKLMLALNVYQISYLKGHARICNTNSCKNLSTSFGFSGVKINMSKTNPHEKLLHTLKEDYSKRIDEIDAFSKRLANISVEVNTEFLYGCLDVAQHYLDLQKRYSTQYPWPYFPDLITNAIKQNTQAWIQAVQNVDTVCIDSMKNMKNNLRTLNKNAVLFIENAEKVADTYKNTQANTTNESEILIKP